MSKKNKAIEVRIEDTTKAIHGKDYTVNYLLVKNVSVRF